MTRSHLGGALCVILLAAMGVYVMRNTYWVDMPIPMPPKGDAATNPFYAARRFAEALGATTSRAHSPVAPSPGSVIVLSAWHWDLTPERQSTIKQWVESGGRLVVDDELSGDVSQFESWSGLEWDFNEAAADAHEKSYDHGDPDPECPSVEQVVPQDGTSYAMCGHYFSFVKTSRPIQWALRDAAGLQAVRVGVGAGSVTVINRTPFTWRSLVEGDHAALFVAATGLQHGDDVLFLTEDDHPSLLALLWIYGAPAVSLSLTLLALFLWRGGARFGPMLALPEPRRRSMAEQIRGSGSFAVRFGEGAPLHEAAARALTEAARRRIPAYSQLSQPERAAALGKATGMSGDAIVSAIDNAGQRRARELPNTLALLESARRQLLNPGA